MFRGQREFGRKGLTQSGAQAGAQGGAQAGAQAAAVTADDVPLEPDFAAAQQAVDDVLEAKLRTFVGPNADVYIDLLRRQQQKKTARKFCWGAFFMPMAWLFYRKMYIEGILLFLLPLGLVIVFPNFDFSGMMISVFVGMLGISYYLGKAQKKIKTIAQAGLAPQDEELLLEKSGGVSKPAAWFAVIFNIVVIAAFVLVTIAEQQAVNG